jgi:stage II sporulation protein D
MLCLLLSASLVLAQGVSSRPLIIRVLLAQQATAKLIVATSHNAVYQDGTVLTQSTRPLEWQVRVTPSGKLGVETAQGLFDTGRQQLNLQTERDGYFQFAGTVYRGSVILSARGNSVVVVNALDVEDYVRGVLPREMPTNWEDEALKAQAVIARTYAISRLNQNGDYDVCATEQCQVYQGASAETPRGNGASEATRGFILSWQGRPAQTFFHADSGGFTASSREIWGGNVPYLQARPDPGSRTSPTPWRVAVSNATIQAAVNRFAAKAGTYRSLSISSRTESGRPSAIDIIGSSGTARITGTAVYAFSRAIGAKSSMIGLESANPLVIVGYGNGHGVGLSQYGAKYFAQQGYGYQQILGYYYPGVSIGQYEVQ